MGSGTPDVTLHPTNCRSPATNGRRNVARPDVLRRNASRLRHWPRGHASRLRHWPRVTARPRHCRGVTRRLGETSKPVSLPAVSDPGGQHPAMSPVRRWCLTRRRSAYSGHCDQNKCLGRGARGPAALGVTVDVVALTIREGALSVMLIERERPPFAGTWALPGAFVTARAGRHLGDARGARCARPRGGGRRRRPGRPSPGAAGDLRRTRARSPDAGHLDRLPRLRAEPAGCGRRAGGPDRGLGHGRAGCDGHRPRRSPSTTPRSSRRAWNGPGPSSSTRPSPPHSCPACSRSATSSRYTRPSGAPTSTCRTCGARCWAPSGFVAPDRPRRDPRRRASEADPRSSTGRVPGAILNPPITRPTTRAAIPRRSARPASTRRSSMDARAGPHRGRCRHRGPDRGAHGRRAWRPRPAAGAGAHRGGGLVELVRAGWRGRRPGSGRRRWRCTSQDTLVAGRGLCRRSAVETLVREIPDRVAELRAWGVPFDDDLGLEGGHSRRRIAHVAGCRDRSCHHPGAGRPGPRRPPHHHRRGRARPRGRARAPTS